MFSNFKQLYKYTDQYVKIIIFLSLITGIIFFAAEYGFIISLQGFLATIGIADKSQINLPTWFPTSEIPALLFFLGIGLMRIISQMAKSYLMGVANLTFLEKQRKKMFNFSVYFAKDTNSHEMSTLFTDILARVGSAVLEITGLVTALTTTGLLLVAGFSKVPLEMTVSCTFLIITYLPIKLMNKKINVIGGSLNNISNNIYKHLLYGIRHNYFFKAHGLEKEHTLQGKHYIEDYTHKYKSYYILSSLKNGLPNMIGIFVICVVSYLGTSIFNTSPENLLIFLYLFIRVAQGAGELSLIFANLRLHLPSIVDLNKWNKKMDSSLSNIKEFSPDIDNNFNISNLKTEGLSFKYANKFIFKDINFSLSTGDKLIILGESGSGKSTLLSLLLGINKIQEGNILVNNEIIYENLKKIFSKLSYVGPDPFLFTTSIRDNLLYGNPKTVSDDEIWKALSICKADEFVKMKNNKLDFILDEHAEISTGQKQRISLARAILRNPQLLVLDEATANLDETTESIVLSNIIKAYPKIIIILVTHKPALQKFGNHILDMNQNTFDNPKAIIDPSTLPAN